MPLRYVHIHSPVSAHLEVLDGVPGSVQLLSQFHTNCSIVVELLHGSTTLHHTQREGGREGGRQGGREER